MALAGFVFRQEDITRAKTTYGAITNLDFPLTPNGDHVLPSGGHVKFVEVAGGGAAEDDIDGFLKRRSFRIAEWTEYHINIFEVGFLVGAGICPNDFHLSSYR